MKLKLLLIIICLGCNVKAFSQVKFGFELNAYASKLTNISPDTIVPWGYSGAKVTQSPSFSLAPAVVVRKELGKRFSLETGLGYWSNNFGLHLQFQHPLFRYEIDSVLHISLKYFQVPVLLYYKVPLKDKTSLLLSGGIRSKILIHQKDNYQDIIFEAIGFSADFNPYKRIVLAPAFAFSLNMQIGKSRSLELGLFGSIDATPFANPVWGFYENLHTGRNLHSGVSVKFFL